MKYLICILSVVIFSRIGLTQQFSTLYDFNGFANEGTSIVKLGDGYLTTHAAFNMETSKYTTLISEFDQLGNRYWDTTLTNTQQQFTSPLGYYPNILLPGEEKWVVGYFFDDTDSIFPYIIQFSSTGIWQNISILDTLYDLIPQLRNPRIFTGVIADSGVYLAGKCIIDSSLYALIVKYDFEGNYLWHTTYLDQMNVAAQRLLDVGDGLVLGARRYWNNNSNSFVQKLSYDGIVQWTTTFSNVDLRLGASGIMKLDNGNYLFAGSRYIQGTEEQPVLKEINAETGVVLWTKLYLEADELHRLYNMKKLSDGGYLGVGECWVDIIPDSVNGPADNVAYIMKLDSEFNLLWKRNYIPDGYAEISPSSAHCQLNDFVENEDGTITALGRVYMYTGDGPQGGYIQDSYILKVDSMGCLVSGCEVGIQEFEAYNDLILYPNPAHDQFILETGIYFNQPASIVIFDAQGRLVMTDSWPAGEKRKQVAVENLENGLYLVVVETNEGRVMIKRILKV